MRVVYAILAAGCLISSALCTAALALVPAVLMARGNYHDPPAFYRGMLWDLWRSPPAVLAVLLLLSGAACALRAVRGVDRDLRPGD